MGPDLWKIVATEFLSPRIRKNCLKSSILVQVEKKKKKLFNDINCLKTLLLLPYKRLLRWSLSDWNLTFEKEGKEGGKKEGKEGETEGRNSTYKFQK